MEGSSKVFQIPYLHQLIGLLILLRFQVIESHNKNCRPIQDNWQTHRQHNTQRQKLKAFLRRSGIRQWCPLLPGYLIQYWKFQLQKSDKKIYNRHANAMLSHFSCVRLCVTPQTAAHQAPLSLRFSRQEHGVGCHFLLQCMKVKSESEVTSVVSDSVQPHRRQPTRLLRPWDFPSKSTGVGCYCLLQQIETTAYKIDKQQGPTVQHMFTIL